MATHHVIHALGATAIRDVRDVEIAEFVHPGAHDVRRAADAAAIGVFSRIGADIGDHFGKRVGLDGL